MAEVLYQAASSAIGIVVETNDVAKCQQRLAAFRSSLHDPGLSNLTFRRSPDRPSSELWIIRTGVDPELEFKNKAEMDQMIEDITKDLSNE